MNDDIYISANGGSVIALENLIFVSEILSLFFRRLVLSRVLRRLYNIAIDPEH